jgi:hypothetical protein
MIRTPGTQPKFQTVIAGGWKLVRTHLAAGRTREELFNLDIDPLEENDLAASRPDVGQRLTHLLERYESAAEPFSPAEEFVPEPTDLERLRALGYVE